MSDVSNANAEVIDKNRKLWLDTRDVPVITTTKNGEANAIRWGWTEARAVAADALKSAASVPVQGERELAAEAWAIRNEFLAFWGRHSSNDLAAVGYSPRMPETPILDRWHPRDGSGEAVQGEPNDDREALASVEAELAEWLSGKRSWCDQHHGLLNQFELTAKADEAQIRLLMTRRDALRTEVQGEPSDDEVDRARDVIDRTFGWKHLRKYGPRSEEWMDQLRDGLVRGVLGGVPANRPSRATVPDAATEALERVRAIHRETGAGGDCAVCNGWGWPCPTVAALDGAPEPEVKP